MEDLLTEYRVAGLALGICTFLIIGLFHPIVIKAEYYWGTRCWWVFLLLGLGGVVASVCVSDLFVSSLLGVFAFSSFWTINASARAGFPKIRAASTSSDEKSRSRLAYLTKKHYFCPRYPAKGCTGLVAQLVRATDS